MKQRRELSTQITDNLMLAVLGAFTAGLCVGALLSIIEKLTVKDGASNGE